MSGTDPIRDYLRAFSRRLPGNSLCAHRVLEEVEDHLRETADLLGREGFEPVEAATVAVRRFGPPAEILRHFDQEAPIESEVWTMLRYVLTPIVALTILYAGLMLVFSLLDRDGSTTMLAAKWGVAVGVIVFGLWLLRALWKAGPASGWAMWCLFCGGLTLVAIGSANLVWVAHLGQVTGDWEYYGFVGGGLLVLEGALAGVHAMLGERRISKYAA